MEDTNTQTPADGSASAQTTDSPATEVNLNQGNPPKKTRWVMMMGGSALAVTLLAGGVFLAQGIFSDPGPLVPTLDLAAADIGPSLTARLIGDRDGVEIHSFTTEEAEAGFTAPSDAHVIYTCPDSTSQNVHVSTAHGDHKNFRESRYWGYEYSGNEDANMSAGMTGLDLFDGRFWLSDGEMDASGDAYGYLNTEDMTMVAGKRYYLMSSIALLVSCIDSDNDKLTDARENQIGTDINDADTDDDGLTDWTEVTPPDDKVLDPLNLDTDEDGVQDGTEIGANVAMSYTSVPPFIADEDPETATDPNNPDTDGDGLMDGEEDVNFNGMVDEGETDPNDPEDGAVPVCGDGVVGRSESCDDENIEDEDGCNSSCEVEDGYGCEGEPSVCEPLIPDLPGGSGSVAMLSVVEKSIGTEDTAVENQKDVTFFRFEAKAGEADDIFLTSIKLKADEGTLVDAGDYTLWVDTDNNNEVDLVLESGHGCDGVCDGSSESSDYVFFNNITGGGYTIPDGQTVAFEVHADIAGSLSGEDSLSIGFNDIDDNFISAEKTVDGAPLEGVCTDGGTTGGSCMEGSQIDVSTTTSIVFNLVPQGTLFVRQDPTPTRSRQLLAGELGESILNMEFRAEDEPIEVARLEFSAAGTFSSMDRLELYRAGEPEAFAHATMNACEDSRAIKTTYCALMESQQLVIPEGEQVTVRIRPRMDSDEEGAEYDSFHIYFLNGPSTDENGKQWGPQARGAISSNSLEYDTNGTPDKGEMILEDVSGNINDVIFAKIISIENANADADGSAVPIGTNNRIAEFKFTATENQNTRYGYNKVALEDIIFNVESSNVSFSGGSFAIHNKNDSIQKIECADTNTVDDFFVTCTGADNTAVDLEIGSGESVTLVLEANILHNQVSSIEESSLQVSITDFSDRSLDALSPTGSHIKWSDSLDEITEMHFFWIEHDEPVVKSTLYQS